MKIAVIGTGRMGKALGRLWSANGHEIMFGSREEATGLATAQQIGNGTLGGTIEDSAEFCEVALFAFPWYAFTDIERTLGGRLDAKIAIDCINPFRSTGSLALGHKWSAGEEVQKVLHRTHVVKAFNHLYYTALENADYAGQAATVFHCSNYDDAKSIVVQLATEMGYDPVDAGPIKNARLLEPLAALWNQLAFMTHQGPETAFKLIRR